MSDTVQIVGLIFMFLVMLLGLISAKLNELTMTIFFMMSALILGVMLF